MDTRSGLENFTYELGKTGIVKNAAYLISNGYGTTKVPLRLGAEPETHIVTLCGKNNF